MQCTQGEILKMICFRCKGTLLGRIKKEKKVYTERYCFELGRITHFSTIIGRIHVGRIHVGRIRIQDCGSEMIYITKSGMNTEVENVKIRWYSSSEVLIT